MIHDLMIHDSMMDDLMMDGQMTLKKKEEGPKSDRTRMILMILMIATTGHHGRHPAAIIDTERGGVLAMLSLYSASQPSALMAKHVQDIPTGTAHDERS